MVTVVSGGLVAAVNINGTGPLVMLCLDYQDRIVCDIYCFALHDSENIYMAIKLLPLYSLE